MSAFKVLQIQFQMFIKSRFYFDDEYVDMTRNKFLQYTRLDILEFRDTLIQNMDYVKKSIEKRALHKMKYDSRANERLMQTAEEKVDSSKALDARQQHTEQPELNNEGEVDQNAEQCHDTCPLPATLTDNQTTELSNQSLESKNIRLKKTVAKFQKDFLRMEAHCVNLELKYQNQALKEGQHGQFLKVKSNEAKVKHDIDVIETINIELEHSVAKLLERRAVHKEKRALGNDLQDLFCFIKRTRGTSFNGQKQQRIDLNADALYNAKQENLRMTSAHNRSELGIHDHSNEPSSSKLVPKVVPLAVKTATSRQELELLFHHHIAMLRTTGINPMIQPEPEDLPKDNPKLEIAVLRMKKKLMDKGCKRKKPSTQLKGRNRSIHMHVRIQVELADIENDIMRPVEALHNLPAISDFSQQNLSHLSRRYTRYLLTTSLLNRIILNRCKRLHAPKMRHSMKMLAKDTRSQDGIDDKDNDKGSKSRSQSMKEQAYNKEQRERPRPHELNDKSNLIDLMKECHQ
ncbi:hypothetical protein Tco_0692484 [Tanacetum coccineum]